MYLVESLIDSDQKEKIKTNKNNAIALYLAKDTCLLIINRFAKKGYYDTIKLSAEEKIIINKNCYLTKYPVPKFYIYDYDPYNNSLWQFKKGENNTEVSLSDDYTLYVLDAKSGKFVTDSLLSKYEFMPKNWEHGFSRGIAVNKKENIVIYWLNVW